MYTFSLFLIVNLYILWLFFTYLGPFLLCVLLLRDWLFVAGLVEEYRVPVSRPRDESTKVGLSDRLRTELLRPKLVRLPTVLFL